MLSEDFSISPRCLMKQTLDWCSSCTGATGGGLLAPHAQGSNSRQTFAVFADENVVPTAMPAQTRDWQTVPGKEAHRENEQGPGRWTGARVSHTCIYDMAP